MQRNPVCALTYGVCADLCHEFGGLQFDIRKSVITADSLCAYLAQNAWNPPDAEQCYQWLSRHISNSPPTIMCACAIVSVTISRLTDAPDPLIALGRGMRCLIYGPGNCIYDNLCSAAEENNIDLSLSAYISTPILRTPTPPKQPKYMQATQNNQYNGSVYQGCTFTTHNTTNNFYGAPPSSPKPKGSEAPSISPPDFFCISARFTEENIRERLAAELAQATSKRDYCRGLYRLQHMGCININQYASDAQRAIVFNRYQSKFELFASDFCKARMNN